MAYAPSYCSLMYSIARSVHAVKPERAPLEEAEAVTAVHVHWRLSDFSRTCCSPPQMVPFCTDRFGVHDVIDLPSFAWCGSFHQAGSPFDRIDLGTLTSAHYYCMFMKR
jgi:hypothetical protein